MKCQILGLLLNTLDADDKYPVLNKDNLTIPIQMQLPQKQNSFSQFLPQFLKSSLNFKIVSKKITLIDLLFPKLWPQKTWLEMSKNSGWRRSFDKQHGRRVKELLKSAS